MKILLVDDHAIVCDGLQVLLEQTAGLEVVSKTSSGSFALAYLRQHEVDLLITDYAMPDMDGVALVRNAKQIKPELKLIVLSMHDEPVLIREMLAAGIDAYVLKKYAQQELVNAIETVGRGMQYWSAEVNRVLLSTILPQEAGENQITDRELEVLRLLADELTSKQIAERLFISERTVETHRKNLMRKTGANNAIGLLRYAYNKKIL